MERHPDPDHDAVCASEAAHRVVVAPPGTGKTHLAVRLAGAMTARLPASPLPETTVGGRVLLLTFSNQARGQLEREAAKQLDPDTRRRVVVSNYHSLFWSAVRSHRRALGLGDRLQIVSVGRRQAALAAAEPSAAAAIARHKGLLDAFAEHAFPAFHDERTPPAEELGALLEAVAVEQRAGRLVFDDLGALFWQLLERFPAVAEGYRSRFPVVIADEHQDASALQDAVIRRLASHTKIILADPMQLIHDFRGARDERLDAHLAECDDAQFELSTPHRWRTEPDAGRWLLAVRQRLRGSMVSAPRPAGLQIITTPGYQGFGGLVFTKARYAVTGAFRAGATRVAVLTRQNKDAAKIRSYLSREGLFPRESSAGSDFEAAQRDIELLSADANPQELALHIINRLSGLVPGLDSATVTQITRRIGPDGVRLGGAGERARPLLAALAPLYEQGACEFFAVMVSALDACRDAGHHLPQRQALRPLRDTATAARSGATLSALVAAYAERVAHATTHTSSKEPAGLYVMNVHQAKGKEFDAVVLLPTSARHFGTTLEDRRLFYVALTRARSRWTLICPDNDRSPLLDLL